MQAGVEGLARSSAKPRLRAGIWSVFLTWPIAGTKGQLRVSPGAGALKETACAGTKTPLLWRWILGLAVCKEQLSLQRFGVSKKS